MFSAELLGRLSLVKLSINNFIFLISILSWCVICLSICKGFFGKFVLFCISLEISSIKLSLVAFNKYVSFFLVSKSSISLEKVLGHGNCRNTLELL